MKDSEERVVRGGTRWRRFAALMVPAAAAAGAVVFGMANGAIAASFSVSGQTFKVSASELNGSGFTQYGGQVKGTDGKVTPVAISGIKKADLHNLCQSVRVPNTDIVLVIKAGGDGNPAQATDLLLAMDSLQGDATFTNIAIGRDASDIATSTPSDGFGVGHAAPGSFGQSSDKVDIVGLKQVARSTTAGTFALNGLNLTLNFKGTECF